MAKFGIDAPTSLGFTTDISKTGIFIKTTTVIPIGNRVVISLTLRDDSAVELSGTVVWNKKAPAGLDRVMPKNGIGILLNEPSEIYLKFVSSLDSTVSEKNNVS